jgi:hypothetical protein
MPSLILRRLAVCAAIALLVSACQNVPKYKKSNGKFDEWSSYQGKHFEPSHGVVSAINPAAGTVTITNGKDVKVFPVTANTRIIDEGTDIPLAQLPLNEAVKYTVTEDGAHLLTVWYGHRLYVFPSAGAQKKAHSPSL